MLRTTGVRVLARHDLDAALDLVAADPVRNVFVESRLRTAALAPGLLGGSVLGFFRRGRLAALCHIGANLVPVGGDEESLAAFAEEVRDRPRQTSTIVGPVDQVEILWRHLDDGWPAPRDLRWNQPHLEMGTASLVEPDPDVRPSTLDDMEQLFPACVAMYTEEVGVSPHDHGGERFYRQRVEQLVKAGLSLGKYTPEGELLFKAELACVTPRAAQVQGVFVPPAHRGQGIAVPAMAAVVEHTLVEIAPVVSLYVNDHNTAARATYAQVGFEQTDTFATLMF